ncbi:hypothetical protein [Paenibacillus sp. BK720]|uniref:hypothetical protein n=1 Tax=Paenibacillus sp. BK720 TaxID=2587092 RepID=UPI001421A10F|nr:hypothetical protein [Paenibacillus sp. BK720]NIK68804.1 hypothetical protein [Paenibacillus sp. BK720]
MAEPSAEKSIDIKKNRRTAYKAEQAVFLPYLDAACTRWFAAMLRMLLEMAWKADFRIPFFRLIFRRGMNRLANAFDRFNGFAAFDRLAAFDRFAAFNGFTAVTAFLFGAAFLLAEAVSGFFGVRTAAVTQSFYFLFSITHRP